MDETQSQAPNEETPHAAVRPLIAIVGRQNVGKSTLLNRLAGRRIAIVEDLPGTTRDRLTANVSWLDREFTLIDTGGVESKGSSSFTGEINRQVDIAINEAELILFMVDAKDGLMPSDQDIAAMLRPEKKRVLLVVNKADNDKLGHELPGVRPPGTGESLSASALTTAGASTTCWTPFWSACPRPRQ